MTDFFISYTKADKEWAEWEADFEEKLGRSLGGELLRLHVTPYIDTDSDPRCADDLLVIQHKCLDLAVRVYPLLKNVILSSE